jgi:hypothetical protein
MDNPIDDLKKMIDREHAGNQRWAAAALGIAESYLSMILSGKRNIPDSILRRLGYEWQIVRVNPMPHPADALGVPSLVERNLVKSPEAGEAADYKDWQKTRKINSP